MFDKGTLVFGPLQMVFLEAINMKNMTLLLQRIMTKD
jgi:hypothetical protein